MLVLISVGIRGITKKTNLFYIAATKKKQNQKLQLKLALLRNQVSPWTRQEKKPAFTELLAVFYLNSTTFDYCILLRT